jgi:molybdate transport system substrate-binding protein
MRKLIACLLTLLAAPSAAMSMEVICPPLIGEGMTDFAKAYTQQTGIPVTVKAAVMGRIMADIKAGPADVVILPAGLMEGLAKENGVQPGSRQKVGRMEIALAVRPGVPHPDISTLAKFAAALKSAGTVAYTQPGPPRNSMEAGMIDQILHRPEFSGVHALTVTTGSGISALAKGDADMALQATSAIISSKNVELVGPLPSELGAHMDLEAAMSRDTANAQAAQDFIRYITRPETEKDWKRFGLDR